MHSAAAAQALLWSSACCHELLQRAAASITIAWRARACTWGSGLVDG
jgi:hypothetical protein